MCILHVLSKLFISISIHYAIVEVLCELFTRILMQPRFRKNILFQNDLLQRFVHLKKVHIFLQNENIFYV